MAKLKSLLERHCLQCDTLRYWSVTAFGVTRYINGSTHSWNDSWVAKDEQKWYVALLVVSVVCYIATFAFSGYLFMWFNPSNHDCGWNVFFIIMTMILAFAFAVIALHPKVNGSLLPASVISVYCAYVCYTGLSSDSRDYICNGFHNKSKTVTTSTLVLGMLTTVLSVLYSAIRAGSLTTFMSPPSSPRSGAKKFLLVSEELESGKGSLEARPVSYSYAFFHLIFALASMYSAMLLSGWTSSSDNSELIDVGAGHQSGFTYVRNGLLLDFMFGPLWLHYSSLTANSINRDVMIKYVVISLS